MARMLWDVNSAELLFSILELVIKEPLIFALGTMFIISTKLTLFVLIFMPISGSFSKLAKNLRAKSLEAQKKVVN
jgi:subfamily B ATP-binding cassette protein MsbA